VRSMQQWVDRTLQTRTLTTSLVALFGGASLLLASLGLFGVVSYTASLRGREFGIRLALGARPAQVRTMILSHGMQLLLVGSIIGLVSAITLSRFLQRVLFEASGADSRIYLGVAAVMFAATMLACWLPARRASRVDPMVALRIE